MELAEQLGGFAGQLTESEDRSGRPVEYEAMSPSSTPGR